MGRGCHAFRRTFATAYLRENVGDLRGLQKLLRHDNIGTTVLYDYPQPEDLAPRLARVFGMNGSRPASAPPPTMVPAAGPPRPEAPASGPADQETPLRWLGGLEDAP
jgi:hypothetical protein